MAEQLAFEQAGGNGGAIELDERSVLAATQAMDGLGDQFLAGAGLAENQDRGLTRGDRCHLVEDLLERRTVTNDLGELPFGPDFAFQVLPLFVETLLQDLDFGRGPVVFQSDRELSSDLRQQRQVFRLKGAGPGAAQDENPQDPIRPEKRDTTQGLETFGEEVFCNLGSEALHLVPGKN